MNRSRYVCVVWVVTALTWVLWHEGGSLVSVADVELTSPSPPPSVSEVDSQVVSSFQTLNIEPNTTTASDDDRLPLLEGMREAVVGIAKQQDYNFTEMMRLSAEMLTVVNHPTDIRSTSINNLTCPPNPHQGVRKKNGCTQCSKYKRYVSNCDTTGTLFMDVRLPSFIHVMDTIAKKASFKPGMRVLDWGSGCGTKLNYWRMRYGIHGMGLDYTKVTVDYAQNRSRDGLTFCWADGSKALKYLPENSFDRVVSHSALYHVMPVTSQCKVVIQAVRITKPGGMIWFGHFRSAPAIKFWKKGPLHACPKLSNFNIEAHTWKDTHIFEGKESWYKSIHAISIVIYKKESNDTDLIDGSSDSTSGSHSSSTPT
eukprot:TRINITY_DN8308_c0_g1_i2.p1 TRINITY_DN8308_c0_g1~~TRINITY_DN8308_c0_g1_i2.p1  ORF type:complete len:369 (+),score=69.25 TRINITY_DN8308_c0_g1_i2:56-1162(+)